MSKKTERITIRVTPSTKHSLEKLPEDTGPWARDIIDRELSKRELMKDEKKKKAPAKIERVKELNSELEGLEQELSDRRSRLKELQKVVSSLENEVSKKKNLKQSIVEEIQDETGMDEYMIKGATGELE